MMPVKIRRQVLGELAVAAAKVNNAAYELAIKANRVQGWLIRHRPPVPASGGRSAAA